MDQLEKLKFPWIKMKYNQKKRKKEAVKNLIDQGDLDLDIGIEIDLKTEIVNGIDHLEDLGHDQGLLIMHELIFLNYESMSINIYSGIKEVVIEGVTYQGAEIGMKKDGFLEKKGMLLIILMLDHLMGSSCLPLVLEIPSMGFLIHIIVILTQQL